MKRRLYRFSIHGVVIFGRSLSAIFSGVLRQIIEGLIREHEGDRVPVIVFTKGGGNWLEDITTCGADCIGLDWSVSVAAARRRTADKVALQGNMDPMVLFAGEEAIRQEARRIIDSFGVVGAGGHVFNLGMVSASIQIRRPLQFSSTKCIPIPVGHMLKP